MLSDGRIGNCSLLSSLYVFLSVVQLVYSCSIADDVEVNAHITCLLNLNGSPSPVFSAESCKEIMGA